MDVTARVPGTLFAQPWWLDAVAPGQWHAATVEQGGQIVARMPYVLRRHFGFNFVVMPQLTPSLGPAFLPLTGKPATRLARQHELLTALEEQLPDHAYFAQNWHYSQTNWLPFYWRDYQQTVRYTYIFPDLSDLEALWSGLRDSVRRAIRKARKQVVIRDDLSIDALLDLNENSFARQGQALPYSRELVRRVDGAAQARGCRRLLFAEDSQGRLHGGLFLLWDEESAYYLIGGGDSELRSSGAFSLLIWEAVQHSATVSRSFDFEGSMTQPIERFFRGFGAQQTPYFRVQKTSSLLLHLGLTVAQPLSASMGRRLILRRGSA